MPLQTAQALSLTMPPRPLFPPENLRPSPTPRGGDSPRQGTVWAGTRAYQPVAGLWSASNTGLTKLFVRALALAPSAPTTLYAGTDGGGVFVITFND